MEVWKRSYTMEVWKVVLSRLLSIKYHKRFLCHGSVKKFLHCGSVEGYTELVVEH